MAGENAPLSRALTAAYAAVGTAGNDATTIIGRAPFPGAVLGLRLIPAGATAGAASVSRKWELVNKGQAGAGTTVMAAADCLTKTPTDGVTTLGSATVSSATAAFVLSDVGKPISGTGIPANSVIGSLISATQVTLATAPLWAGGTPVLATANGTSITFTITASQAAYDEWDGGLSIVANALNVLAGDVIALVSTHLSTGVTDPGGLVIAEIGSVQATP